MAVNYHGKKFANIGLGAYLNTVVIYCGAAAIYHGMLTLENVSTAVNYCGIFITLAQGVDVIRLFSRSLMERPIKPDFFRQAQSFWIWADIYKTMTIFIMTSL